MEKKFFCVFLCFCLLLPALCVPARGYTPTDFEVQSAEVCLFNPESGTVLYEKDADARAYPAALTNIMTALLLCETYGDLTETLTVPEAAKTLLLGTGAAILGLVPGEEIAAGDLLYALLLNSAPDAAITVAYAMDGDIPAFLERMNAKAGELGMTGTHFANVTGLHDANHYTTARDMGLLAAAAMDVPAIADAAGERRHTIPATALHDRRILSSTNALIDSASSYHYRYATGLKTGFTNEAGRCLAAAARYEGDFYICILLRAPDNPAARAEFQDAARLFQWAFGEFAYKTVLSAQTPVGEIAVDLSWETDHVTLYPQTDFSALVPKAADSSTVTVECDLPARSLDAPVKKGTVIGTARVLYAGNTIGSVTVVAGDDIRKNAFLSFVRILKNIGTSWPFRLILLAALLGVVVFIVAVIRMNRGRRKRRRGY